jgi:tripartite-type tricarboxylate transporter receptor subunit TctC
MLIDGVPPQQKNIESGVVRALGVTTRTRAASLPNVPTMIEQGIDYEVPYWTAIYAPAATPKPIVDKLVVELRKAIALPDVQKTLTETLGMEVIALGPDATQKWIGDAIARWGKVVRDNGIKAE